MNTQDDKMTLEDLLVRKRELKRQIEDQHQLLGSMYRVLTEPFSFNSMQTSLIKKLTTGFAIFDGLMLGLKIIRKIRNIFR